MSTSVQFVVGNTYQRISPLHANFDRSKRFRKVHDWTLFLDVVAGDADVIERVSFDLGGSFDPQVFVCSCPIRVTRPNGRPAWRFSTRQQSYGAVTAQIKIRGSGGTTRAIDDVRVILDPQSMQRKPQVSSFAEPRPLVAFRPLKIPDGQNYGIELEVTSSSHVPPEMIAYQLSPSKGASIVQPQGRRNNDYSDWKIVPDGSIACSPSSPDCHKFELVSPILTGGNGLSVVSQALNKCLETAIRQKLLTVNRSMGFHVHVNVAGLSIQQLIKICQNFIKYEQVMDAFMPPSRRNGGAECQRYFKSNKLHSVPGSNNKERHDALASCQHDADAVYSLVEMMNRGEDRYYKLNLTNLITPGRAQTIEFRQHSATLNYLKVSSWVRFCIHLVTNSAKLAPPSSFKDSRDDDIEFQCKALFQYVIKDRCLRDFYTSRIQSLKNEEEASAKADIDECVVCCDSPATMMQLPCRHKTCCKECIENLFQRGQRECPICRAKIVRIVATTASSNRSSASSASASRQGVGY